MGGVGFVSLVMKVVGHVALVMGGVAHVTLVMGGVGHITRYHEMGGALSWVTVTMRWEECCQGLLLL